MSFHSNQDAFGELSRSRNLSSLTTYSFLQQAFQTSRSDTNPRGLASAIFSSCDRWPPKFIVKRPQLASPALVTSSMCTIGSFGPRKCALQSRRRFGVTNELSRDDQGARGRVVVYKYNVNHAVKNYHALNNYHNQRVNMPEEPFATKYAVDPTNAYDASKLKGKSVVITGG